MSQSFYFLSTKSINHNIDHNHYSSEPVQENDFVKLRKFSVTLLLGIDRSFGWGEIFSSCMTYFRPIAREQKHIH